MVLPDRPNLLRIVLGKRLQDCGTGHTVIETNIDDSSPEIVAYAVQAAFDAGALDAWTVPIQMKKGRSAVMFSALASREKAQNVAQAVLSETSSLGVRMYEVARIERPRRVVEVETRYGKVRVKIAEGDGLAVQVAPEYEDCRALAQQNRVPIKTVYAEALHAASHRE